jgi:type II secretory pathway pseudopilin PulG
MKIKFCSSFSLVELLIVITILTILMSLLSPSLRKAIESSRSIQCGKQLNGIYGICQIYVDDHDGFLPNNYFNYEVIIAGLGPQWWRQLSFYLIGKEEAKKVNGRNSIYTCPNAMERRNDVEFPNTYSVHNRLMPGQDEKHNKVRPESVARPSDLILIGDADQMIKSSADSWTVFKRPLVPWIYPKASDVSKAENPLTFLTNEDFNDGPQNFLRYRHIGESQVNTISADGGVKSFFIGEVQEKHINTSY